MHGTSKGKTGRGEHILIEGGCIVYKLHCIYDGKRVVCDAILIVQERLVTYFWVVLYVTFYFGYCLCHFMNSMIVKRGWKIDYR